MFRYFTSEDEFNEDIVYIVGADEKHLKNTLRAEIGQEVAVITDGSEYIAEIVGFENDGIACKIKYKTDKNNEASIDIFLCQSLPKQAKMEDIIQQNVEVGVKGFIPLITDRTVVKLNDKARELKKLDRWRKVAHESSKQSKRNIVPVVDNIMTIDELIERAKSENAQIIVPYELEDNKTMKEALNVKKDRYFVVIGPEGGFDISEILKLQSAGAEVVTLGKRILRTETAGIVASSIILYQCDEMGR